MIIRHSKMEADRFNAEDEQQLLAKLGRGDAESFTILYHRYGYKVHAHLLRMVKSEEAAKEIFQDIFMKIWENRRQIDPHKSFGGYLYRIAENKVYDYFRKISREKRFTDSLASSLDHFHNDSENDLLYKESLLLVQNAIEQLPPVRKKVYLLSKMEGKSYEEIAVLMGVSTATINDHIVKANRFLKTYLTKYTDLVLAWLVAMWV